MEQSAWISDDTDEELRGFEDACDESAPESVNSDSEAFQKRRAHASDEDSDEKMTRSNKKPRKDANNEGTHTQKPGNSQVVETHSHHTRSKEPPGANNTDMIDKIDTEGMTQTKNGKVSESKNKINSETDQRKKKS